MGALVSKLAGGNIGAGALAGAVSEIANGVLQDVLKANPNLNEEQRNVITQWVAAIVGVAAGGQTGAATALDNINFNYLNHADNDALNEAKSACAKGDQAACSEKARLEAKDEQQQNEYVACRNSGYSGAGCGAVLADVVAALSSYAGTASAWSSASDQAANFARLDKSGGLAQIVQILAPVGFNNLSPEKQDELIKTVSFLVSDPFMILGLPDVIKKASDGDPMALAQILTLATRLKLFGSSAASVVGENAGAPT